MLFIDTHVWMYRSPTLFIYLKKIYNSGERSIYGGIGGKISTYVQKVH